MRQVEFRAYVTQAELKRLRQRKSSAGWVAGAVAIALAWIFSAFGMSPARLNFGDLKLGSSGRLPVELTNRGLTEFRPASITVEGVDARDFTLDSGQSCATVKAGEGCVLWVDFRPQGPGEKHARLIVRSDDGSELSSEFAGKATGKEIPPQIHTGPIRTDSSAPTPPESQESSNPTDKHNQEPPHVTPPVIANNSPHTDPNSGPISSPPGLTTKPVDTAPPATVPDTGPQPTNPNPLPHVSPPPTLTPTPTTKAPTLQPRPHITMTPGVAEFQAASPNAELVVPSIRPITVTSDGTGDVQQLNLKIGRPGGVFSYRPGCPTYLARGKSCTVRVQFVSRDTQSHVDSLSAFDASVHMATVTLRAPGSASKPPVGQPPAPPYVAPHVTMTPTELGFGATTFNAMAYIPPPSRVEVRNDGPVDLRAFTLQINPSSSPFRFKNSCSATLPRGQSCTVQVALDSTKGQASQATLGAYEGGSMLAAVRLSTAGSNPAPAKPPGGTVKSGVDGAYPNGSTAPGSVPQSRAKATIPSSGMAKSAVVPSGSAVPPVVTRPDASGSRVMVPGRAATTVQQTPRPTPPPPPVRKAPVRRADPRPPPIH